MNNHFDKSYMCLKPFLNVLSLFLGILFLGLTSCYSINVSSPDTTPPTLTISTDKSFEINIPGTITFTFSEEVNGFTKDDVKFSSDDFSVNDITISNFITNNNNPREYSLDITPKVAGTLYVSIPTNSFEDLSGNQNTDNFSNSFRIRENTPPTVTSINSETLIEEGNPVFLSFTFSEKVTNFTPDDILFLSTGVSVDKGKFFTNRLTNYSLEVTPKTSGTLYVTIRANSFEDLSGNQNTDSFSNSFSVEDKTPDTTNHTISFKLNGGSFKDPQITNLKVLDNTAIEQTRLGEILSYPPTGPKPSIQAVTRDIFEWRTNGTKYDFSTPVSSDLTLEAVWSNSCGKVETFHPTNRNELQNYIDSAVGANSTTNLNHIDTSSITDMNSLFYGKSSFNRKIDCWNTAKVTTMSSMFETANAFNQDIGSWDVAKVTNMYGMFYHASAFNQDIKSWDVSKVNNMWNMFQNASAFNQNIGKWNVANVTNMYGMFFSAIAFNGDIGNWNVSKVTDMSYMFNNASAFNQNIGKWNVTNVNNMRAMFDRATSFNQNLISWDVAKVTNMYGMFYYASAFNQDIGNWDVGNVNNMRSMFDRASAFNQDIGNWDVGNVNNMRAMFFSADSFNQDISSWDVANVTNMKAMFFSADAFDQNLSSWSVSNVASYKDMFTGSAMESKTNWHPNF